MKSLFSMEEMSFYRVIMMEVKIVKVYDISDMGSLLDKFLDYGFTLESLSRGTNTPIAFIEECVSMGKKFKEPHKVVRAFDFLVTIDNYFGFDKDNDYYKNIVESVCRLYKVPEAAIANFLGLNNQQFKTFLQNPEIYPNGFQILTKMQWILQMFSNDKREFYEITGKHGDDEIQVDYSYESMEGVESISVPIYMEEES